MKHLRSVIIGIAMLAMAIPLSGKAFADMGQGTCSKEGKGKEYSAAKIKVLKDSAMALTASNPALAKELQKMSEKKYIEKEEVGEKVEPKSEQNENKK